MCSHIFRHTQCHIISVISGQCDIRCFLKISISYCIQFRTGKAQFPFWRFFLSEQVIDICDHPCIYAPESVSDEDVSKVIARTGIQEMQKRFEQKEKPWNLETTVSGGERQRINLARALLKNGSIYIFDEATSALDTETEKIVQQTLRELSKTKVVIIISHRLSSVRKADKIYVLDEGSVQENGSHEELMKKKGRYYRLFEEQVKKNDEKQITG